MPRSSSRAFTHRSRPRSKSTARAVLRNCSTPATPGWSTKSLSHTQNQQARGDCFGLFLCASIADMIYPGVVIRLEIKEVSMYRTRCLAGAAFAIILCLPKHLTAQCVVNGTLSVDAVELING